MSRSSRMNWDSARPTKQATVVKSDGPAREPLPPMPRNLMRRPLPNPPMQRIKK